jgi:hypothetical protein
LREKREMTYADYTATAEIVPGDILISVMYAETQYGPYLSYTEYEVSQVEADRIQVINPDGGNYRSNRNRSARTRWYKRTSPMLAETVIAR